MKRMMTKHDQEKLNSLKKSQIYVKRNNEDTSKISNPHRLFVHANAKSKMLNRFFTYFSSELINKYRTI